MNTQIQSTLHTSFYIFLLFFLHICTLCFAQVRLQKILVNGKEISVAKRPISLTAGANDLILEFTSEKRDSITYLYRLKGLETSWIATKYPVARYQDLTGGAYTFEIKSLIDKKLISTSKIGIIKKKAFWNEIWFIPAIILYALVVIGVGIYLFLLYDFRQKLRMQSVRNQIAADLHDEVGSNLNSIAIFVEILRKNAPANMLPILEKIIENSTESVSLMQDTVWTINPKNDSIYKLFDRMNSFASQLLAGKDIAFDFSVRADLKKINFTMDQRKSVYLIYKEAINNIVKHAEATKVNVTIDWLKDTLEILIEDNGRGFDTSTNFEGNGLHNFKERALESDIGLIIESEKEKGTRIKMSVEP
ncbi:sensor histidine kinase [Dyadobacter sp. 3J3]|uniref:sensor histidine kinase n=1 Tax=Dyadobacter sp. 3J3 TaxID=2606600 RepID=UPI00135C022D|nr:ATP-binding protein [Dyadobacter sp. 3J3]